MEKEERKGTEEDGEREEGINEEDVFVKNCTAYMFKNVILSGFN